MRIAALVGLLIFAVACGSSPVAETRQRNASSGLADLSAVMLKNWATLGQLASEAELIVIGTVTETEGRDYGALPFTLATVQVERTVKGQSARSIGLLQTGGVLGPPKGADPSKYVPEELGFEGVRVTRVGERYLLFLRPYIGPLTQSAYVVLGEFQGKLLIDETGQFSFAGDTARLSERQFATHLAVFGRSEADVVGEIGRYLR